MDANDDNWDVVLSLVSFNVKTMCFISPFISEYNSIDMVKKRKDIVCQKIIRDKRTIPFICGRESEYKVFHE